MSSKNVMSDDHVAELLKRDARDTSVRYSALGLEAFLPKRPTTNAPKPNTRFLRNIIRDTDNHNAALLAKEAEESRQRLNALKRSDGRTRHHGSSSSAGNTADGHARRSQSEALTRGDEDERGSRRHGRRLEHSSRRSPGDSRQGRGHRFERDDRSADDLYEGTRRASRQRHHRHRIRPVEGIDAKTRQRHHRRRSRSPRSSRSSRSPPRHRSKDRGHNRSRRAERHRSASSDATAKNGHRDKPSKTQDRQPGSVRLHQETSGASDSDPLESIIGPIPPKAAPRVKVRGRGALASSEIDARFSSGYDPTADVRPNSASEDDWDQALEALRDRQRWKQQGAERLRSAGFTEEEVEKWEQGGQAGEKREEDVRWAGRGEGREWDRGKVVDEAGDVDLKPEWGRLKGT